jgi:APA family basic amino acid/polyamine antiporter
MVTTEELLAEPKEEKKEAHEEKKAGILTVIALTVASMIGSGLFFGASIAASYAGPASLIAWILLGIVTVYVGMCFGELVAMFPSAGGVYEFTKQSYGRFPSFIIGWITWVTGNLAGAVLLIAGIDYIVTVFPDLFPAEHTAIIKLVMGIVIVIFLNLITFRGVEASGALLGFFSAAAVAIVLAIIFRGVFEVDLGNFTPFFPYSPVFIFVAFFFIVETFFGWDGATYIAEETENPEKVIPKVLVWTCIGITVAGFVMAFVLLGVIPWEQLILSATPAADVATILFGSLGAPLVGIGVFLALTGATASIVVTSPRLLLALARDKLFVDSMADVHPRYGTPYKAIVFQTIVSILMLLIGFGQYTMMLSLEVPLALFLYIAVICCVPVLRYKLPDFPRAYKIKFGVVGPILVSLLYTSVIVVWIFEDPTALTTFLIGLSIVGIAIPIYMLLTVYHNPDVIIPIINDISMLQYWLEDFLLPRDIRKQVLAMFEGYEGKNILEFGSGVGTMTMHLAELVKPGGHIYAVDLSKGNLKILEKRSAKKGHGHVHVIHDEHQVNRVHPDVPKVDMIFSFGMLSYIQDLKKVLKELHIRLPEGGQVCFIEYANLYKILPNVGWLSHPDKIREVFKENGFSVTVQVYNGMLWDYVVIYGIKSKEGVPYI